MKIEPDAYDIPTLWDGSDPPVALARRCDVHPTVWLLIMAAVQEQEPIKGKFRSELIRRANKAALSDEKKLAKFYLDAEQYLWERTRVE